MNYKVGTVVSMCPAIKYIDDPELYSRAEIVVSAPCKLSVSTIVR